MNESKRYKHFDGLMLLMTIYCLFIWRSWKIVNAPSINDIPGTNEIYLIGALCLLMLILCFIQSYKRKIPISHPGVVYFFLILFIFLRTVMLRNYNSQNVYAAVISYLPMMLAVIPQKRAVENIRTVIVPLALVLSLYSVAGIISFFATKQLRLYLPLGVATTLVFLFIVAIPIINLGVQLSQNKAITFILRIGFWMTIFATILTVSRAGIPIAGIISAWCIFEKTEKKKRTTRLFGITIGFFFVLFIVSFFFSLDSSLIDLSRLFGGFGDSSTSERGRAAILGLEIFKNNFWFGAGNGTYFTRIYSFSYWTDKLISAYGKSGLLDPHNAYVLLLSESGIIGFVLFMWVIVKIVKRFQNITERSIRIAGFQILVGVALYSFTSSDLFSVVGLSSIIWYVIGTLISYSYRENGEICR